MNSNLKKYSDEELIERFQKGDLSVEDYLIDKYKALVRKKARLYFLEGGDQEDLLQEGMIGIFKAIREYDPGRNTSFFTFAEVCINRQMLSAIQSATRKKNKVLNESVSLNDVNDSGLNSALGTYPDPETIFVEQEAADALLQDINKKLSPMEKRVLDMYLSGMDYLEIAEALGKKGKSIDNALQRIKKKIKDNE